jgi:hypothetical protein
MASCTATDVRVMRERRVHGVLSSFSRLLYELREASEAEHALDQGAGLRPEQSLRGMLEEHVARPRGP